MINFWKFRKNNGKHNNDQFSNYKKQKLSPSRLKDLNLDAPLNSGIKCGNCLKVFYKFSEVYVEELKAMVPCCPFCKSNVLETEIIPL